MFCKLSHLFGSRPANQGCIKRKACDTINELRLFIWFFAHSEETIVLIEFAIMLELLHHSP